jgi:hypothetical protein
MITTLTRQVVKRCPYKDETDVGEIAIVIGDEAPELHGLAADIDKLTVAPVSHEDFTWQVSRLLPGAHVTTRWRTGPWAVTVEVGFAVPR